MKSIKKIFIIILLISIFIILTPIYAEGNTTEIIGEIDSNSLTLSNDNYINENQIDLGNQIETAKDNDMISIEPGTYKIHNIHITKNITIQGKGNPQDIILDGEKQSSIFLIRSSNVYVTFKNITFINGLTDNFGGAISSETGHIYVDNCIFINNTALKETNAGAISNYGTKENRGYLFVNNSLFINNHADHDGGAITTCYANSDIYNCVFINNSAVRDGGAIRVSVYGYGNVQDCIFMFNHADEWGGAYYSWSGESNIERCIFMNNTAGTNGGAVMVSGNINIEDSIIVNNDGGETGGSFYIQQPMYDTKTTINVHNNIITNNTSPYGKEIFIKWRDSYNLYTQFDDNDWGDEDPNDSSINDPNNVTPRSKVSRTVKSNLFSKLNVDLLDKYKDLLGDFFTDDSLNNLKNQFKKEDNTNQKKSNPQSKNKNTRININTLKKNNINGNHTSDNLKNSIESNPQTSSTSNSNQILTGNSTSQGEYNKAYELNKTDKSTIKQAATSNINYFIATVIIAFILLSIGYIRNKR